MLLYGCGCTVFAFGLKLIVRSPELLCCMIPFFIIGSLLFCPVFVDPGRWIPGMEQLGRISGVFREKIPFEIIFEKN